MYNFLAKLLFLTILISTSTYSIPGHSLCESDDQSPCCDQTPLKWCLKTHHLVFKILTESQWEEFKSNGKFYGSPHDMRDGFIHLSTGSQLGRVLNKYFENTPVYISGHDPKDFYPHLKWEKGYPHLYNGPLTIEFTLGPKFYFEEK
ncbi:DUF952 domain-containing protein [Bacteriovoracaceae bacterium]|nr:DUF952 domain-containing protein [Bacteriovoracaceae bacterium]